MNIELISTLIKYAASGNPIPDWFEWIFILIGILMLPFELLRQLFGG